LHERERNDVARPIDHDRRIVFESNVVSPMSQARAAAA
jgi:hypothetical protein